MIDAKTKALPTVIRALKVLGTSHRTIAATVGVSDMSVSRWGDGRCRPDPERLRAVVSLAAEVIAAKAPLPGLTAERLGRFVNGAPDASLLTHFDKVLAAVNPLRALRLQRGLSVTAAAGALSVTRQYVHELEGLPPDAPRLTPILRRAARKFPGRSPAAAPDPA